jgi:ferredoxin--NADP+ reductase
MLQQLDGWRAVDAAEVVLGATRGRADTILHERRTLLATAEAADARADVNSAPVSATNLAGSGTRNE